MVARSIPAADRQPVGGTGCSASGAPLLEVSNLSTGYGDLRVVWDLSFTVEAGKVTALLGRNGAGKTTTLRAIAGLNPVSKGAVRLEGHDIGGLAAHRRFRRGLALVQDNKRIFRNRTVEENLLLGGYTMRRKDMRPAMERAYEQFPILASRRRTLAGTLSGGQQQMVAIAQALMPGPSLLMLDEPSGGLAPSICDDVFAIVADLRTHGIGILLVEQEVGRALKVADDVLVIDVGRVRWPGRRQRSQTSRPSGMPTSVRSIRSRTRGDRISERTQA